MDLGVGTIHEGTVSGITKFGAFVSLSEGKAGLVHISEIANSYVNDVRDFLSEGQMVKVKVIGVDESGRIKLSMKKAEAPAASPRREPYVRKTPVQPKHGTDCDASKGKNRSFEDKLKQFMQEADTRISEIKGYEKRSPPRRSRKG